MEEKKFCIYKHTNKINGKVYIGQTCRNPEVRWNHGEGYKKSTYFYSAIKKYGWDGFEHDILYSNLTLEEANRLEQELILAYDSMNREVGYNLCSGGNNNIPNEEARERMSLAQTGPKNHNYGKSKSEEVKKKLSEAGKRKIVTEESKQKNRLSHMGKKNPNYGKPRTESIRKKISEKQKGCPSHFLGMKHKLESKKKTSLANSKAVYCIETQTFYYGASEAARQLNFCQSGITLCCQGKMKTYKRYHWRYATEEEIEKWKENENESN